ncbi:MAG: 4'-phosphopantetheinyl transferase superfamily protein [Dysgonamonadaceae bacterium]|jgi:4'-phosphopantetheinyl transferase EntD|nr:4'-phosphopantetheinyl transferase superfamily protein [Dysgonamonadaceae bacterium]
MIYFCSLDGIGKIKAGMTSIDTTNNSIVAISPIRFSSEELFSLLEKKEYYNAVQEMKNEKRKREWLSARLLMKEILGEEKEIVYSPTGKPRLKDKSYHISISHTKGYVAVALQKDKPVGIDIEQLSDRVNHIRHRFMNPAEEETLSVKNETVHLLLHWSAKESLFKILDDNRLAFNTDLHISPFEPEINQWSKFQSFETKTKERQSFTVDYLVTDDYVVTVAK